MKVLRFWEILRSEKNISGNIAKGKSVNAIIINKEIMKKMRKEHLRN